MALPIDWMAFLEPVLSYVWHPAFRCQPLPRLSCISIVLTCATSEGRTICAMERPMPEAPAERRRSSLVRSAASSLSFPSFGNGGGVLLRVQLACPRRSRAFASSLICSRQVSHILTSRLLPFPLRQFRANSGNPRHCRDHEFLVRPVPIKFGVSVVRPVHHPDHSAIHWRWSATFFSLPNPVLSGAQVSRLIVA